MFAVDYAVYDSQGIIKPDRDIRTKEFPTLKGALGFWWKKAIENRGVAHLRFKKTVLTGSDIKDHINRLPFIDRKYASPDTLIMWAAKRLGV